VRGSGKGRKYLIYLFYFLFLFILFEGSSRILLLNWHRGSNDASWRHRWLKRRNIVDIFFAFDRFDQTKGWISKPNLRNFHVFSDKFLNTNSFGLRGKKEILHKRSPHRQRFLILGDSFTFGDEVSDNETYSFFCSKCFLIQK
jgi:hypothetical protein